MPKKNGLGRDVSKSLEIMDSLVGCLRDFAHIPLKKGLASNKIHDDQITKNINKAFEEAIALINSVEDLKTQIRNVKMDRNSRFASNVVARFLNNQLIQPENQDL